MFGWIAAKWASRAGKPLMIVGAVLLLLLAVFLLGRCTGGDNEAAVQAQTEQSDRSSDALATAASNAIETLEDRTATEDAIDQVVQQTVGEIEQAATPAEVREAVIEAVCLQASHRNDPACVGAGVDL